MQFTSIYGYSNFFFGSISNYDNTRVTSGDVMIAFLTPRIACSANSISSNALWTSKREFISGVLTTNFQYLYRHINGLYRDNLFR